jgi:hypothetical protein
LIGTKLGFLVLGREGAQQTEDRRRRSRRKKKDG